MTKPVAYLVGLLKAHFVVHERFQFLHPGYSDGPFPRPALRAKGDALFAHVAGPEWADFVEVEYQKSKGELKLNPENEIGSIRDHARIGAYAVSAEGKSRWICWDFESAGGHKTHLDDPFGDATRHIGLLRERGWISYLEQSKSGGWHVWAFLNAPQASEDVVILGEFLAPKDCYVHQKNASAEPVVAIVNGSPGGLECFPKTARGANNNLDQAIWLPWFWNAGAEGRNEFRNPEDFNSIWNHADIKFELISDELFQRDLAEAKRELARQEEARPRTTEKKHNAEFDAAQYREWERRALWMVGPEVIYGNYLTGKKTAYGDVAQLECRDPRSPSGDRKPSARVYYDDKREDYLNFYSLIHKDGFTAADFLIQVERRFPDFNAYREWLRSASGVPYPHERKAARNGANGAHPVAAANGREPAPSFPEPAAAPRPEPAPQHPSSPSSTPASLVPDPLKLHRIQRNMREDPPIIREIWEALHHYNQIEERVFIRSGQLARIVCGDENALTIADMTKEDILGYMRRAASWYRIGEKGIENPCSPPPALAGDLLSHPDQSLPNLISISQGPLYSPTGKIYNKIGYHSEVRAYIGKAGALDIGEIPNNPTDAEIAEARRFLSEEILGDFPFSTPADKANMVALIIQPFVRNIIEGCMPLFIIEAPKQGTGKGLLIHILSAIATGKTSNPEPMPDDEKEIQKTLFSQILEGNPIIFLDNAKGKVESKSLAVYLTGEYVRGRMLGKTETRACANRANWVLTGNNVILGGDLARRGIRVRIDAGMEKPWERPTSGYRHPRLLQWVKQNRAQIVRHIFIAIKAWEAKGKPLGAKIEKADFPEWSGVLGGIIETLGISDFLGNLKEFYESSNMENTQIEEFVSSWYEKHAEDAVTARELLDLCIEKEVMVEELRIGAAGSPTIRLGHSLKAIDGQVVIGYKVATHKSKTRGIPNTYSLEKINRKPA